MDDVRTVVNSDRRMRVCEIADEKGTTYEYGANFDTDLKMRKVSARWVLRLLSAHDMER